MPPIKLLLPFTIMFTKPHSSATSDNLSRYLCNAVLLGIDTFYPRTFIALRPFIVSSRFSLPTSNTR